MIVDACEEYARRWAKNEDVKVDTLSEWIKSIPVVLKRRIRRLKHSVNTRYESIFSDPDVVRELSRLHGNFVIVPADKASNNYTYCAPLLADIFLYSYKADFIQSLLSTGKKHLEYRFNLTYWYINNVLSINNPEFENYLGQMYPAELEIKDATEITPSASFLDLLLSIGRNGKLHTSIYDKRDDINFHITNFPFLSSNVIFHLCNHMAFLSLNLYDTPVLAPPMNVLFLGPGDIPVSFINRDTWWKACNRHSGSFMVDMGILFSNMKFSLTNFKWHSDPWPTVTSQPIRLSTNFMTFIPTLTFTELWVVSMKHLRRVWHASRERLPFRTPGSAPPPILGLNCALIAETIFLKLAMSLLGFSPRIPLGTFSILLFILHVYHPCPFPPMKLVAHCAVSSQVLSWPCLFGVCPGSLLLLVQIHVKHVMVIHNGYFYSLLRIEESTNSAKEYFGYPKRKCLSWNT